MTFHAKSSLFLLAAGSLFGLFGQALTEAQAVKKAIEKSPDLISARISYDRQKVNLKSARDEFALAAEVWAPYSKSWTENLLADRQTESDITGLHASFTRLFRWGGKAEILAGTYYPVNAADSQSWSGSIHFSQPFLKGAGKYAPANVELYTQQMELEAGLHRLASQWALGISSVRLAYWDWIARASLIRIRERQMDYAQQELLWQKARFRLGAASEIDTMNAGLQYLEAQSGHASALQAEKTARRALAGLLECRPEDIRQPQNLAIEIPPIAPFLTVLAQSESVSAELRILSSERKGLERRLGYARNRLLPSLNASAFFERTGLNRQSPLTQNIGVGAELRFDLFSRGARNDANRTRLDLALNQLRTQKISRDIRSGLEDLYDTWRSDSLRYELAQRQWTMAQRLYEAIQQEEKLGAADTQTRRKALDDLTQAEIDKLEKQLALKRIEIAMDEMTLGGFNKFGVKLHE